MSGQLSMFQCLELAVNFVADEFTASAAMEDANVTGKKRHISTHIFVAKFANEWRMDLFRMHFRFMLNDWS